MPTITFATEKKEIQVPEGANLRKEATRRGSLDFTQRVLQSPQLPRHGVLWKLSECSSPKEWRTPSPRGLLEKARFMGMFLWPTLGTKRPCGLHVKHAVNGDITVTTCPPTNLYGENFFS